jgi:hypothetical protein
LLIDQVNKLAMLQERRIIHVYHKNLKLMVNQIKTHRMYGGRQASFHVVVGQAASIRM